MHFLFPFKHMDNNKGYLVAFYSVPVFDMKTLHTLCNLIPSTIQVVVVVIVVI